ncbi:hypothetical protein [Sphingomonas soli]|uniref:hypothetical protein n=1 Tax=Sphingomonas soli TaxID=266127 RepID=UPI0008342BD9|nr:hypothetical protein [Sphingomonas soli]
MYRVEYDRQANVMRIHVEGFWNLKNVSGFAAAVGVATNHARDAGRDDFDVIVESLDFPVQGTEVADLLTDVMRAGMSQTNGRSAVVVGSHLNRLQAERTLVHPRVRVFLSMEEAEAWLAGG